MFSNHGFLIKSYVCHCNDEIVVNLTRPLKSDSIFLIDLIICSVPYWILYRFNKEILSFNFYHWPLKDTSVRFISTLFRLYICFALYSYPQLIIIKEQMCVKPFFSKKEARI